MADVAPAVGTSKRTAIEPKAVAAGTDPIATRTAKALPGGGTRSGCGADVASTTGAPAAPTRRPSGSRSQTPLALKNRNGASWSGCASRAAATAEAEALWTTLEGLFVWRRNGGRLDGSMGTLFTDGVKQKMLTFFQQLIRDAVTK